MATIRFEIEKFDGEKIFNFWQVRMMVILVQSGLKKVVTGKKPENLNKVEWEELDEKALSAIQLCLVNTVLQEVLMEKTSSALWKRLETLYVTKSLANRLVLKQRLFPFRMNESENVEVHIDDEDQAMLLLCSLPLSYKSFRETLIYGRDKLSFEDVKGHLLSREKLDNEFHLDSKVDRQPFVLVASKKRDKRCRYCKKLGHVKADCYKLRNKRTAESNEEDVAGVNLANKNGDDFLLVSTSNNSKLTSEWILDSGCSFHMCPNREWFSTYNSVEGGVVHMGKNSSSKVIGIGTVKIRIHDGTIMTLSDVRQVYLSNSSIALARLDYRTQRTRSTSNALECLRTLKSGLFRIRLNLFEIVDSSHLLGDRQQLVTLSIVLVDYVKAETLLLRLGIDISERDPINNLAHCFLVLKVKHADGLLIMVTNNGDILLTISHPINNACAIGFENDSLKIFRVGQFHTPYQRAKFNPLYPNDRLCTGYFDYGLVSVGHNFTLVIPMSVGHNLFTLELFDEALGAKLVCWLDLHICLNQIVNLWNMLIGLPRSSHYPTITR
ncbi:hypothetical protein CXB51_019003 [Gossypium anomalum]|uniref:Retrovirus-related Pol polyprotein from transposon TNT 1-94-like beta-barrel domain-containing protein n=1 Tax=Gossypium anomalum TaxID=47600 RepID=A0A8J6CSE3_9ROSI|nr:hypothetical protein CXB51_019003 [Gossypium anomalum]